MCGRQEGGCAAAAPAASAAPRERPIQPTPTSWRAPVPCSIVRAGLRMLPAKLLASRHPLFLGRVQRTLHEWEACPPARPQLERVLRARLKDRVRRRPGAWPAAAPAAAAMHSTARAAGDGPEGRCDPTGRPRPGLPSAAPRSSIPCTTFRRTAPLTCSQFCKRSAACASLAAAACLLPPSMRPASARARLLPMLLALAPPGPAAAP